MLDLELESKIKPIHQNSKTTYRLPKFRAESRTQGLNVNKKQIHEGYKNRYYC